jgi:signal transduction histidine kinase
MEGSVELDVTPGAQEGGWQPPQQGAMAEPSLADAARALRAEWTEHLARATSAIAAAASAEQVHQAILEQLAATLGATSTGVWTIEDDEDVARLCRAAGYDRARAQAVASLALCDPAPLPVVDAVRTGQLIWVASSADLLARYPGLDGLVDGGPAHAVVCSPLMTRTRRLGGLALTFDHTRPLSEAEHGYLVLVSRLGAQALERLRLLRDERTSRSRAELLVRLAGAVLGASRIDEIFGAALDAIGPALGTERAAVLLYDAQDVMRFRAWRGLSDEYRRAVEGHSPWKRDARDPEPVLVPDVGVDAGLAGFLPLFRRERIGALGFIPLVSAGRLLGKFMVYYDRPRELSRTELALGRAIANHVAAAVARFDSVADLQETLRFNQMFIGILGHDLRNPLAAIITSARVALARDATDRLRRPLARILNCGDRMTRMIDQLLDFTRVRLGGGIPVARVELDLAALVRQVMDELDGVQPACALRLSCAGRTQGRWDPDRLSQVFSNLVANAVRHGVPEDGVDVKLDGQDPKVVRVEVHNRGAIPPRRLPTLFEPMSGSSRSREKAQGLGLGLFITRELVRAHGGSIEVRSDEVEGTTFTVTLPRGAAEPPGPE